MINIGICDDERYMLDQMKRMVSDFFNRKNIDIKICQFSSGVELLRNERTMDILFLDIQMKDMDGMETARRLRNSNFSGYLIFVTILKEMVFQSFEVQAFDYLVKPIQESHFNKTMERLFCSMKNRGKENLLIQKGTESSIIAFDEIIFCEIIDRKVYLHLRSTDVIDYYDRMENLEKKLDGRFYKCHRSYLINLQYLKNYKNGTAYMTGGGEIPVSRLRSKEFSGVILQFMKEWRL